MIVKSTPLAGMLAVLLLCAFPAHATDDKPGRYTMSPADGGGFVRLDTETGAMALCQRRDAEWSCREMAEPNRGLGDEVERLRAETAIEGELFLIRKGKRENFLIRIERG